MLSRSEAQLCTVLDCVSQTACLTDYVLSLIAIHYSAGEEENRK